MRGLVPLVLAATLMAVPVATAQPGGDPEPVSIPAGGTELFRAFLDQRGINPITRAELDSGRVTRYDDVIVIVLGSRTNFDALHYVSVAINNGGGVLVAADTETQLYSIWGPNGDATWPFISSQRVECALPNAHLGDRTHCPFVVPITAQDRRFGGVAADSSTALGKLFGGDPAQGLPPLTRVATNNPSYLFTTGGFAGYFRFALARFPTGSVRRTGERQTATLPDNALFAVGGYGPDEVNARSAYHFLAMADHSVFINQMLLEPGTDNLELTYRVIDYLRKPNPNNPKESTRKRCLFVENGRVVERFDELRQAFKQGMPIPQVNLWAIQDKLVDLGNAILDDVQTRDVPNKILVGGFTLPVIMRFVVLILSIYATWFVLRKVFGGRKPGDTPPAPTVAGAPSGPPGVFERRQKELLRRNNVYEPVRDLLREFFAALGVPDDPGPKHPKLVIADVVRKPESLRKAIKDFWKLAYGPLETLTVNRWREMEPYFDRVRQAHADGKWHFVSEEATAGSVA